MPRLTLRRQRWGAASSAPNAAYILSLSPAAWYRLNMGITQAAGTASAWADQSGNSRNLVQAVAGSQPVVEADGALSFPNAASGRIMQAAYTRAQPSTTYCLMRQNAFSDNARTMDGGAGGASMFLTQRVAPGTLGAGNSTEALFSGAAVGAFGIYAIVWNGAASVIQTDALPGATVSLGTSGSNGLTLGQSRSTGFASNCTFKEVIDFPGAHSALTRANVIAYLAALP